jgi:DNA-binding NarL/FixJ family response regulator
VQLHETNGLTDRRNGAPGAVRIEGASSLASVGLEIALKESGIRAHRRRPEAPQDPTPSVVVYCTEDKEDDLKEDVLTLRVRELKELAPNAAAIVIFAASADLSLARAAVLAGAKGFLHAGMPPEQITRALRKVGEGEEVMPREVLMGLIKEMVANEREPDLSSLGSRKIEILEMVAEGLSNAQIAKRLYLAESTVKQHLRSAYKALGVKNRNQAGRLVRNNHHRSGTNGMR